MWSTVIRLFTQKWIIQIIVLAKNKEVNDVVLAVPNDTAYKRCICYGRYKLTCKLCRNLPPTAMDGRFTVFFGQAGHADPLDGWTGSSKKRMMSRQIHDRKHISIRYNMIEHWVHLRCTGIRLAQYTDTWTCHLHKASGLTAHNSHRYNTTPPLQTLV